MIELRPKFPLPALLRAAGLPRSTFYYQQAALAAEDKYAATKDLIKSVFDQHKGRYGYRRITATLRRQGTVINHKTVQRLMDELQLKSIVRPKKYRSYRGQVGKAAPNLLERNFRASGPNQKWATDVTEFKVDGKKLYLSPVVDLFNGEIVAYATSRSPLFTMVGAMLNRAFAKLRPGDRPVLHSDQGWQYQMEQYRQRLTANAVTQSMSRKGIRICVVRLTRGGGLAAMDWVPWHLLEQRSEYAFAVKAAHAIGQTPAAVNDDERWAKRNRAR